MDKDFQEGIQKWEAYKWVNAPLTSPKWEDESKYVQEYHEWQNKIKNIKDGIIPLDQLYAWDFIK